MRRWSVVWIWPTWIAAVAVSFGVIETVAYRSGRAPDPADRIPTLSRCSLRWLGVHPRTRWALLAWPAFLAAPAVFLVHLFRLDRS